MSMNSFSVKEVEGESPNWLELPREITTDILQRLCTIDIVTSACQVCPLWWNICKDPLMWRTVDMTRHTLRYYPKVNLIKICRIAIDRSCGQLENIDIGDFGTDDLLAYIADCAGSHLRRLRLEECNEVSEKGFIECVMRLPLLEELDITYNEQLSRYSIKVFAQCCPLLKSLKYGRIADHNGYGMVSDIDCNDEAYAIAETMPGLHNLTISGNVVDNDGVLAILDGCPLLESLDLSHCFNLFLTTSLEIRCLEQIKNVEYSRFGCLDDCDYDCTPTNMEFE